jgi:hypothetical protein
MAAVVCWIVAGGCASTVESRIRANPERFEEFPPEAREAILRGRIQLGFTEDMVLVALGQPARIVTRVTEGGSSTIWVYTRPVAESATDIVPAWSYSRSRYGALRAYPDMIWVDRTVWTERDADRVEFRDGLVVGFERSR